MVKKKASRKVRRRALAKKRRAGNPSGHPGVEGVVTHVSSAPEGNPRSEEREKSSQAQNAEDRQQFAPVYENVPVQKSRVRKVFEPFYLTDVVRVDEHGEVFRETALPDHKLQGAKRHSQRDIERYSKNAWMCWDEFASTGAGITLKYPEGDEVLWLDDCSERTAPESPRLPESYVVDEAKNEKMFQYLRARVGVFVPLPQAIEVAFLPIDSPVIQDRDAFFGWEHKKPTLTISTYATSPSLDPARDSLFLYTASRWDLRSPLGVSGAGDFQIGVGDKDELVERALGGESPKEREYNGPAPVALLSDEARETIDRARVLPVPPLWALPYLPEGLDQ